jgi:hypothetical protein
VNSASGTARNEFINRDFDAAIDIRRCAVLQTRHEDPSRSRVVQQPLRLEVCLDKLKPTAGGWSQKTRRRLRVRTYNYPPWSWVIFCIMDAAFIIRLSLMAPNTTTNMN